jgi:DNA-binding NtrC family response regulator
MDQRTVLVSWIGNTDIRQKGDTKKPGPLEAILRDSSFKELRLLHDNTSTDTMDFIAHIEQNYDVNVTHHSVSLENPTHYADIYRAMDNVLGKLVTKNKAYKITIQITSGTPSMTAVSILLGKAKYKTQFIQSTLEQGVIEPDIPFDIAAEFRPPSSSGGKDSLSRYFLGQVPDTAAFADIITQAPEIEVLKQKAAIIAKRDVPVLIYGETGTGKELFAKAIHNTSNRADKPLLVLNCGAIPPELIDTTLFGHVKGAFTGATTSAEGYFKRADGGTLFLDEFGELPLDVQVRLLRVLQQGTYTPVGSTKELSTDVRIITATNKDLFDEVAKGRFREDLLYRVAIGVLHLPPLRERPGDIVYLANALLEKINAEASTEPDYKHKNISASAINFIKKQSWSGNVRELQATLLRATLWQAGEKLEEHDIAASIIKSPNNTSDILAKDITQGIDINEIFSEAATHYIDKALQYCHGNKTKAAALLGLKNYQTLNNWIEKYGLN